MVTRPPIPVPANAALQLVAPPYATFEAVSSSAPLGSFAVLELDGAVAVEEQLTALKHLPWVPVVVVQRVGTRLTPELLRDLEGVPGMPAFVVKRPEEGLPLTLLGQDAIRSRPQVDPDRAAAWVAARVGRPNLVPSLTVAMSSPARQGWRARLSPSGRWLARRLRTISPLTANDWHDVLEFAAVAGHARFTTAEAAGQLGIDVWTMRRRLERLAEITTEQYRSLAGWEWFLEAVVRRWAIGSPHRPRLKAKRPRL